MKNDPELIFLQDEVNQLAKNKLAFFLTRLRLFLGGNKTGTEKLFKNGKRVIENINQQVALQNDFYQYFGNRGWHLDKKWNIGLVIKAVELAKSGEVDAAEEVLTDFYSNDEVEKRLRGLYPVEVFRIRTMIAEKALSDFKQGKYSSSIKIIFSILDDVVNDIRQKMVFNSATSSEAKHSAPDEKNDISLDIKARLLEQKMLWLTENIDYFKKNNLSEEMEGIDNRKAAVKSWVTLFAVLDCAKIIEMNV